MKISCLLVVLVLSALARADVVLDWNEMALAAIERTSTPPPVAARALAMMHGAIYDAVNSVEYTHQPFRVYFADSSTASREAAASQAAFRVLQQIFPSERARFEEALANSLAQVPDGSEKTAGIRLGEIVAAQIIAWRKDDGSQRSVTYTPGAQPGQWRPTPPDFRPALLPQWSSVAPFGIAYASQFRPAFPPSLDSDEYATNFEEVRTLGAQNSEIRSREQTQIAYFWADGPGTVTPPGHWNRIAQSVTRSTGLSLHENARLFALLNVALADAAIVCWDMKFSCNLWRPITAIQEADTDGNECTTRDPKWRPLLDTPPFPSCTSGHSTFSGAAAQVLALVLGRDTIPFTDTSGVERVSRTYRSFSQAAEEAGRSRIYAGIHFQFDNRAGLESGRAVGRYIVEHYLQPISAPTNNTLATRKPNRLPPDDGWVSASEPRNRTGTTTTSITTTAARPVPASITGSSSPANAYYVPATTYTCPTVMYAADLIVAEYPQVPVLYYEPVVGEYAGVAGLPQSDVMYFFMSAW
jgi:hypothetical protein